MMKKSFILWNDRTSMPDGLHNLFKNERKRILELKARSKKLRAVLFWSDNENI